MTSAKFMLDPRLGAMGLLSLGMMMLSLAGCAAGKPADMLQSPYPTRHVWAVAPLQNLSGSLAADGLLMADHLHRQLENAGDLDVLPVNRAIQAMEFLGLRQVSTREQALKLLQTLAVDGLVVGTLSAYDPYDPPKVGLTLELYTQEKVDEYDAMKLRGLSRQPVEDGPGGLDRPKPAQPVARVGAVLDASDPRTRSALEKYALQRGPQKEKDAWRRYRISIDLYSEFVAYVMSYRLLEAERRRLYPASADAPPRRQNPDLSPITDPVTRKLEYLLE